MYNFILCCVLHPISVVCPNYVLVRVYICISSGVPKFGFVHLLQRSRRFGGGFPWKMASSSQKSDVSAETKSGVVRPATEDYAEEAIEAFKTGKVIAVPTDTLYGFACDACSMEAVNRIYEIKGRKYTSPLAICVGDVRDIQRFAVTDHLPHGLLDCLPSRTSNCGPKARELKYP
ncbi:hypothetical protein F0562_002092 [Nyssa sinensis]|uniref:Threonylcarbamoyl-AMP synthase n=1 Tax=Nyssa sinensis TaxID=561372 RepID=A0A5J5C518_9ASTE|nr:hypothetical protein F0562_002092 [Nyssa sinensis]